MRVSCQGESRSGNVDPPPAICADTGVADPQAITTRLFFFLILSETLSNSPLWQTASSLLPRLLNLPQRRLCWHQRTALR
jgi:hypothetical protein